MRTTIFLIFLTSVAFGQNYLSKRDTTIKNKDGSKIVYRVKPFGTIMQTIKNGTMNGPSKSFDNNGKLRTETNFVNGFIHGKEIEYTQNGDTATISEWKGGNRISMIVYYQSNLNNPDKYFFVSKKGFQLYKDGKKATLGKYTPDSLMEGGFGCTYIWLKGEKNYFQVKNQSKC